MIAKRTLLLALLLLASLFHPAFADSIETYNLKQRQANEIIPIIQPMLPPGSALSGQGYILIVRGNRDAQDMVQQLINKLDGELHNLLISVRFSAPSEITRSRAGADVRVRSADDNGGISARAGQAPRGSAGSVRIQGQDVDIRAGADEQTRSTQDDSDYKVRVLEGNTAYIQTGQDIPYRTTTIYPGGFVQKSVELQPVRSGFYVRPRLHGDEVLLDILPQQESESAAARGRIDTQSVRTTTTARLGEWVELGGISSVSRQQTGQTLYSETDVRNKNNTIYVKVELIP